MKKVTKVHNNQSKSCLICSYFSKACELWIFIAVIPWGKHYLYLIEGDTEPWRSPVSSMCISGPVLWSMVIDFSFNITPSCWLPTSWTFSVSHKNVKWVVTGTATYFRGEACEKRWMSTTELRAQRRSKSNWVAEWLYNVIYIYIYLGMFA